MKRTFHTTLVTLCLLGPTSQIRAEDIDLYKTTAVGSGTLPNVLFIIDNSANWNAQSGGMSKRAIEHQALYETFNSHNYDDKLRAGLMVFTNGNNPGGGKVLRKVQDLTASYGANLADLFNPANMTSNGPIAKSNNAPYALMLNEAYLYFGGKQPRAGLQDGNHDSSAVSGGRYVSPAAGVCGFTYVILIGNGQPDSGEDNDATTVLSAHGGSTATIPVTPDKYQSNLSDEFARFMTNSDVVPDAIQPDKQTVTTYVIDVYDQNEQNSLSNRSAHAWLKSVATAGNGRYFAAHNVSQLKAAITSILSELQAVNSVFAATTLPVSVNVRGTNLNQVYMGQFRPDKFNRPRWDGNLKLYQLAVDPATDTVFLADANNAPAQSPASGFISSSAQSFWTHSSSFWSFKPSGSPASASDAPDGEVVEKGAVAQLLRDRDSSATGDYDDLRILWTSINGADLSSFSASNSSITDTALGVTGSTERQLLIDWVLGTDNKDVDASTAGVQTEDGDSDLTDVRPSIHGDVLHSTPAVINYNNTAADGEVMVYYGANDGIIHAVQGGKDGTNDGNELWGFVPEEFFDRLKLLRDNSSTGKPYFADGSIGVYTKDVDGNKMLRASDGDKVYIYVSMRRGGRFLYALDVTDPDDPRLLWQQDYQDSGYDELGQTWSRPNLALIDDGSNGRKPVLVFGAGYDPAIDDNTAATSGHAMGRGIIIADAVTGTPIWQAGPRASYSGPGVYKRVDNMTYSIPSDVTIIDRNGDKKHDRLYVGDTGGNVWRVDIGDSNPSNWAVYKLASVGAAAGLPERKFLYPPDVVYGEDANGPYDAVLIGSGDREDPFNRTVQDGFYMFKDRATSLSGASIVTISDSDLYDVTDNIIQAGTTADQASARQALLTAKGWKLRLTNSGEKVVGGSITVNGATFFNTTEPPPQDGSTCANLGTARFYTVSYEDATAVVDKDGTAGLTTADRLGTGAGGGFPPSPVPVIVEINDKKYLAVISGPRVDKPGDVDLGARQRVFWYKEME
jgi:type IV pilus assembly protein PilY1